MCVIITDRYIVYYPNGLKSVQSRHTESRTNRTRKENQRVELGSLKKDPGTDIFFGPRPDQFHSKKIDPLIPAWSIFSLDGLNLTCFPDSWRSFSLLYSSSFQKPNREIVLQHLRRCSNVTCCHTSCFVTSGDIHEFPSRHGAGKRRNCRWHQPWCPRSQILWRLQLKRNLRYFDCIWKESKVRIFLCAWTVRTLLFGMWNHHKSRLVMLPISKTCSVVWQHWWVLWPFSASHDFACKPSFKQDIKKRWRLESVRNMSNNSLSLEWAMDIKDGKLLAVLLGHPRWSKDFHTIYALHAQNCFLSTFLITHWYRRNLPPHWGEFRFWRSWWRKAANLDVASLQMW